MTTRRLGVGQLSFSHEIADFSLHGKVYLHIGWTGGVPPFIESCLMIGDHFLMIVVQFAGEIHSVFARVDSASRRFLSRFEDLEVGRTRKLNLLNSLRLGQLMPVTMALERCVNLAV